MLKKKKKKKRSIIKDYSLINLFKKAGTVYQEKSQFSAHYCDPHLLLV